jgi:hypothetical protein
MQNSEITSLCVQACTAYYKYLERKKSGRSIIRVHECSETTITGIFKIKLADPLFNLEAVSFLIYGRDYDSNDIRIVEYDYDTRTLLIKPNSPELNFLAIKNTDIFVVSDLKFLIKRLGEFYLEKGSKINFPDKIPDINFDYQAFEYLAGFLPSLTQKKAIDTIFKNPTSYIWGAPGTGKTRYVLANSLLKCYLENKKIVILAPTNVALEQVMIGILRFTDAAQINRKKILRIGHPSRNFANEYPEVCEVKGIEKQISELTKQIQIIKEILNIDDFSLDNNTLKQIIALTANLSKCEAQITEKENNTNSLKIKDKNKNEQINNCKKSINLKHETIQKYETKSLTIINRFLSSVSSKLSYEPKIKALKQQVAEEYKELNLLESESILLSKNYSVALKEYQLLQNTILKHKSGLNSKKFINKQLQELWDKRSTYSNKTIEITKEIEAINVKKANISLFKDEYKHINAKELELKLNKYISEVEKLKSQSIDERWKDVPIIGATIDGFVNRYLNAEITINHVFIDEAAYCNVIKTMIAFALNCPVTLLGDHFQLPPVIEMDERELADENEVCFPFLHSSLHLESYFKESSATLLSNLKLNIPPSFTILKKSDLIETHRFGENLASILNQYVYRNGFKSTGTMDLLNIEIVHAPKELGEKRRENPSEAKAISKYVDTNKDIDYCILSPYNDQVTLIGKHLPVARQEQKIMTVHKSQGREWDKVIISISDTENMYFTDSTNRKSNAINLLNTAVSRAKKTLVIVCDVNYWNKQQNQLITGIIQASNNSIKN